MPTVPPRLPSPSFMHLSGLCLGLATALLAACASLAPAPGPGAGQVPTLDRPMVLLGEVHDNAAQHALRRQALADWIARGARPALVMEQFDRERQASLDAARAEPRTATAQGLIDAAGSPGWEWPLYAPYLELALAHGLPVIAANVGRESARKVMREGLAATGFEAQVPADLLARHAADIQASHCGQLDATMAARLAPAQVARDQAMAQAVIRAAAERPEVLLLAGNGHVRSDIGVPYWLGRLAPALKARSLSIGIVEVEAGAMPGSGTAVDEPYDRVVLTPVQARPDPCLALQRRPMAPPAAAPATSPQPR